MDNLNLYSYYELKVLSEDPNISNQTKSEIISLLEEKNKTISNLDLLKDIYLQINEDGNNISLKRSKAGKWVEIFTLFFGFFSIPMLGWGIGLLFSNLSNDTLNLQKILSSVFLFITGAYLFVLFIKGWERRLQFARFSFEKNQFNYKLTQMSNFLLKEKTFDLNSELYVKQKDKDASVILSEDNNEINLFDFKELNNMQLETLKAVVSKFNNWS